MNGNGLSEREKADLLLDIAEIGWWETDLISGNSVYSELTAHLLDLDKVGCGFNDFLNAVREDYRKAFVDEFLTIKEGITSSVIFPSTVGLGTGWLHAKYRVIEYQGNRPTRLLGILQPTRDPIKAADETNLRDKQYLERLYQYMPIGYQQIQMVYDNGIPTDYTFLEINKQIEEIRGKRRREIIAARGSAIETHFAEELERMTAVVNTNKHIEYDYYEANTDTHCRAIMFSPLKDMIVCLLLDVTELKLTIIAKDKAETSDRLKSAFLASMSHEIRTPLNAIVGFSEALCEMDDEEQRAEIVEIIRHNNELLLKLISDIFDLSQIEANMMELHKHEFEVKPFVRGIVNVAREKTDDKVAVLFDEDSPDISIYGDQERINQVIVNLVNNALKFTNEGHVRLGYTTADNNMLLFYVEDTGMGIPADDQEAIFDRFVKLDSFVQGTGLGLAVSRNIVYQMDGEMGVESKRGIGSRFWFKIPME